jgi:SAM-dependent methyltransferase
MDCARVFCETFSPEEPIAELGSLYLPGYAEVSDLRPVFAPRRFIGCDIRHGPGVDRIEDAHQLSFGDGSLGAILMFELLEHLPSPAEAVAEARRVLRADGLLALSVPFDYRLHAFPADYWRFTAAGISVLLSGFPDKIVFALGPAVKPGFIFAVATKTASPEFADRKGVFEARIRELQRRTRLRGLRSALRHRGREFLGLVLGRAHLTVEFFEAPDETRYPDDERLIRSSGGRSSSGREDA